MQCKESLKIGFLLNERLSDAEKYVFAEHTKDCQRCLAELRIFRNLKEAVQQKELWRFDLEAINKIINRINDEVKKPFKNSVSRYQTGATSHKKVEWKVAAKVYPKHKKR